MKLKSFFLPTAENDHTPHLLQRAAMVVMAGLVLLSFAMVNLHALLWQSSDWLVGTVLPAVVVDLTNQERGELLARPLTRNPVLDEAARLKARHMAENEYFSHYSPDGISPWYWFKQVSYNFAHAGENLAIHFNDSNNVVEAWMNSPSHRANITNGNYTEIGVGTAKGTYDGFETVYVVQLFGTPAVALDPVVATETELESAKITNITTDISNPVSSSYDLREEFAVIDTEILGAEYEESLTLTEESDIAINKEETDFESKSVVSKNTTAESEDETEIKHEFTKPTSSYMATSSGLTAEITASSVGAGSTERVMLGSIITKPSILLQTTYLVLGTFVVMMLLLSILIGIRNYRPIQVVYGIGLLMLMSGLFYVHITLTAGVTIASELPVEEKFIE